jgi:hypothetical protein
VIAVPNPVASWRKVSCPSCLAQRFERCRTGDGRVATEPHAARRQAARAADLPTPLLSYAWSGESPHIVSAADPLRALCGAAVVEAPTLQPSLLSAHPQCRNLLGKVEAAAVAPPTVACPVCGAEETPGPDMTVPDHKEQRRNKWGVYRADVDCDGAGRKPENADD